MNPNSSTYGVLVNRIEDLETKLKNAKNELEEEKTRIINTEPKSDSHIPANYTSLGGYYKCKNNKCMTESTSFHIDITEFKYPDMEIRRIRLRCTECSEIQKEFIVHDAVLMDFLKIEDGRVEISGDEQSGKSTLVGLIGEILNELHPNAEIITSENSTPEIICWRNDKTRSMKGEPRKLYVPMALVHDLRNPKHSRVEFRDVVRKCLSEYFNLPIYDKREEKPV